MNPADRLGLAADPAPVFVLEEIHKVGSAPGVVLQVLDSAQHDRFHDAFVELALRLSEVLFITTANDTARILPAVHDRRRSSTCPATPTTPTPTPHAGRGRR